MLRPHRDVDSSKKVSHKTRDDLDDAYLHVAVDTFTPNGLHRQIFDIWIVNEYFSETLAHPFTIYNFSVNYNFDPRESI